MSAQSSPIFTLLIGPIISVRSSHCVFPGADPGGLRSTDITGMTYNPLTATYRLSKDDVDVNYLAWFSKPA